MEDVSKIGVDLAIIGSGGGAFAAAIRAANLGKSVLMVEQAAVGGTCVNTGCIPSKALLAAVEARHVARDAPSRFPGINTSAAQVDAQSLMNGKRTLVNNMRAEKYLDLIADYGWDLRQGAARFTGTPDAPVLEVIDASGAASEVQAANYLIATGSTPWIPDVPGLAEFDYLTSTTAMELTDVPESLLVVGGGYVALEQAQYFARLGTRVTMLVRSRLASMEEPEASQALTEAFSDEGICVISRATPRSVATDQSTGHAVVQADVAGSRREFSAAKLLMATGRRAVTDILDLGRVAVETGPQGQVLVNDELATSNPRIWAAGDVTGHPQFVYVASSHGALVVDNAFSASRRRVDYRHLPRVVFTSPALATVGMTEAEATRQGIQCDCRVLPMASVPRAIVNRDTRGFIKMVADRDGRIVGLTAVGKDAGELAAAGVYILEARMTVDQVAHMWAPYLTMAEGIKITAQSYTVDVSRLSCCAI